MGEVANVGDRDVAQCRNPFTDSCRRGRLLGSANKTEKDKEEQEWKMRKSRVNSDLRNARDVEDRIGEGVWGSHL
jgi:hypothetical protein